MLSFRLNSRSSSTCAWINNFSNILPFLLCLFPHICRWNSIFLKNLYISLRLSFNSGLLWNIWSFFKLRHVSACSLWLKLLFIFFEFFSYISSQLVSSEATNFVIFTSYNEVTNCILSDSPDCSWNWNGLLAWSILIPNFDCTIITTWNNFSSDKSCDGEDKTIMTSESNKICAISSPELDCLIIWAWCKSDSWHLSKLSNNIIMSIRDFFLLNTLKP